MRKLILAVAFIIFPFSVSAETYGSNVFINGSSSASSEYPTFEAYKAFDGNESTRWASDATDTPRWLIYNLSSTTASVDKIGFKSDFTSSYSGVKNFSFQGSKNGSDWITIIATTTHSNSGDWVYYTQNNTSTYQYYRIVLADSYTPLPDQWKSVIEFEGYECTDCDIVSSTMVEVNWTQPNIAFAIILSLLGFCMFAFWWWKK